MLHGNHLENPPLPYRPRIRNLAIKALREFLHVSDNSQKDLKENKDNKLYQIEPVLDHVRKNCLEVEPEQDYSIDEQIIPAKPKYSGIRRYNPKKPVKWGFKNFVRSGASGIMYDFFVYTGAASKDETRFSCFRDSKIRIKQCPLLSEKDLKKRRGSFDYRTDMSSSLVIVKWLDNKCVHMCSTYVNLNETSEVQRWDKSERKYTKVTCPEVVKEYNKNMGGVDLSDMLISLYRTRIKARRWYLKLLFHCVDITKVNEWLLYR